MQANKWRWTWLFVIAGLAVGVWKPGDAIAQEQPETEQPAAESPSEETPASAEPATETPAETQPAEEKPAVPLTLSQQAYAASKTAKTEADFSALVELCQQAEAEAQDEAAKKYVQQLQSWALNRRGEAKAVAGDEAAALADFEAAVALDPDRWKARYNRAISLANAGKLAEALADLDRAIELQPNFVKGHFNRGELKFASGDIDGAIRDYDQTLRLDPRNSNSYNARGFAYYSQGNTQQAQRDYDQALRWDGGNAAALVNRGDVYGDRGDFSRAVVDYQQALGANPNSPRAYLSWAWLLATCPVESFRNPQKALEYAQKANELQGAEHYRYLDVLAAAHANAGDFEKAQEAAAKAVALAPKAEQPTYAARLDLYKAKRPYRDARTTVRTNRSR